MDVRGLARLFEYLLYVALALATLAAVGLILFILAIWSWTS